MSGSGNFLLFLLRAKKIQYSGIEFFTDLFIRMSLFGEVNGRAVITFKYEKNKKFNLKKIN
jgi:hypothetical protein